MPVLNRRNCPAGWRRYGALRAIRSAQRSFPNGRSQWSSPTRPAARAIRSSVCFRPSSSASSASRWWIDNRPGGGGMIGAQAVAKAAADGHTLMLGAANNFVINQFLFPKVSFDPLTAFTLITKVADVPSVLYASLSAPRDACRSSSHGRKPIRQAQLRLAQRRHHASPRRRAAEATDRD